MSRFRTSYSGSYSTPLLIVDGEDVEVDFPARLLDKRSGLFENSQPTSLSVGLIVAGTIIFAVSLAALAYYIARRRQRALASDDSMASFIQMEEGGSGGSRSPPYIQPRPPSPYPHHLLPRPPSPYPHHLHSKPLPSLAHLLPPPPQQQQQQQPAHSTARQSKAARATQQLKKVLLPQLQELAKLLDVVPQIARPRKDHYLKSLQEFSAEMMGGQAVWKAKYRPNNTRSHKGPVDSTATTTASGRPRKVNDSYSRREKMKVAGVIGLRPETRTKPDMKIMEYMVKEGCSLAASDPLYTGQTALVVQGPDNEWKVIPKARTSQASSSVASVGTYRPPPPPPSRTSESSAASVDTFRHPPPPSSRTSASSAASVETFRPPPPPPSRISSELSTTDEYSTGPLMPELEIMLAQMVPFGITGQYWHTIRRQMQLATNPRASYNSATPSFLAEVTPAFPAVPQQVAIHEGWPFERRGVDRSATSEHQQPPISARSVSSSSSSASLWSPPTPPPIPSEHSSRMDIDGDCAPVAMQVDGIVNRPSASMQVDVADRPSAAMQGNVMDPPSSKRTKARRKADPSRKYMMPGPANSIIPCTRKHLPAHTMPQIPYSQDFQRLNEIFGPWDYFVPYDLEVIPLQIDGQRIPLVEWTPLLKAIAPELYTQVKVRLSNVIVFIREYRKFANHEDFLKHYPNGFTATVATVRARRQAEAEAFVPRIALRYPDTFGLKKPIAIVSRYEELAIGSPALVDADLAEEIHEYYRVPPTFAPRTSTAS